MLKLQGAGEKNGGVTYEKDISVCTEIRNTQGEIQRGVHGKCRASVYTCIKIAGGGTIYRVTSRKMLYGVPLGESLCIAILSDQIRATPVALAASATAFATAGPTRLSKAAGMM